MKTLDEVLEIMTYEVGLNSKADYWEVPVDLYGVIVHYLHEYQDAKNALDVEREKTIKAYCQWKDAKEKLEAQTNQTVSVWADKHFQFEISDNPPLTWDELQLMEGKPVWVEILSDEIDLSSRWMMVARETKAHSLPLAYTDDIGHWIYGHEDKLGKTWQAYRKERK